MVQARRPTHSPLPRCISSVISRKLRTRVARVAGTDCVLPKSYTVAPQGAQALAALEQEWESPPDGNGAGDSAKAAAEAEEWQHETRYPPAVEQEDAYNLVKFYSLDRSLVYSILAAAFTEKLEFPFLPDEAEHPSSASPSGAAYSSLAAAARARLPSSCNACG